jgi:ankyrin repeat protein
MRLLSFPLVSPQLDGRTPLHYAAKNGNVNMSVMLIQHGANVNSEDKVPPTLTDPAAPCRRGLRARQP